MLTKCVCSNCGHSYLADDELGALACPRCENGAPGVGASQVDLGFESTMFADHAGDDAFSDPTVPRFEAKAPPPMFVTGERLLRGLIFGAIAAATTGAVISAALTAIEVSVVGVTALFMAIIGGAATRGGFGGRSASQTISRAVLVCALAMVCGFAGQLAGAWTITRFTAPHAPQARKDIDEGLFGLSEQYANVDDAGAAVMLRERMERAEELQRMSDAQLEDYLWIQRAQLNQPLLAYGKLWATEFPVMQIAGTEPVVLPMTATLGVHGAELLLAIVIAIRAIRPKRRR